MKSDVRHLARHLIPRPVYQQLSNLADGIAVLRKERLQTFLSLNSCDGRETTLHLKSLRYPFNIRRIASHANGIVQNVLRREYDAWQDGTTPCVIIDAGAFIGDLTCHWATLFPEARIIGLEPNAENFAYAERNTAPYAPNVLVLNKGLWSCPGILSVAGEEMVSHLVDTEDRNSARVEVTDIPSLVFDLGLSRIDVLKLDIEGAERQVLNADSAAWLPLVRRAVVEMHGQDIEDEIVPHMLRQGFQARRYRSLIFFSRPTG